MNAIELIKGHEGLRLRMYQCTAGYWTIGYGHNLEVNGISEAAAELILSDDVSGVRAALTANLPWFVQLDEVRQAALVDLCFNLGWQGLGRFRRFLAAMGRSDWPLAAQELRQSLWYGQVGRRAPRIVGMIETGQWP